MDYWIVYAETPGTLGPNTDIDLSWQPPRINSVHVVLDRTPSDDIIGVGPVYLVSKALADRIGEYGIGDYSLKPAELDTDRYSGLADAPPYMWLDITGRAGSADLGRTPSGVLVASNTALLLLRGYSLRKARFSEWTRQSFGGSSLPTGSADSDPFRYVTLLGHTRSSSHNRSSGQQIGGRR